MPQHHLFTLGVPQLRSDAGEQVRFRTRKHLALVIRLAVESGKRLSRDYLQELLWPEVPPELALGEVTPPAVDGTRSCKPAGVILACAHRREAEPTRDGRGG